MVMVGDSALHVEKRREEPAWYGLELRDFALGEIEPATRTEAPWLGVWLLAYTQRHGTRWQATHSAGLTASQLREFERTHEDFRRVLALIESARFEALRQVAWIHALEHRDAGLLASLLERAPEVDTGERGEAGWLMTAAPPEPTPEEVAAWNARMEAIG